MVWSITASSSLKNLYVSNFWKSYVYLFYILGLSFNFFSPFFNFIYFIFNFINSHIFSKRSFNWCQLLLFFLVLKLLHIFWVLKLLKLQFILFLIFNSFSLFFKRFTEKIIHLAWSIISLWLEGNIYSPVRRSYLSIFLVENADILAASLLISYFLKDSFWHVKDYLMQEYHQ